MRTRIKIQAPHLPYGLTTKVDWRRRGIDDSCPHTAVAKPDRQTKSSPSPPRSDPPILQTIEGVKLRTHIDSPDRDSGNSMKRAVVSPFRPSHLDCGRGPPSSSRNYYWDSRAYDSYDRDDDFERDPENHCLGDDCEGCREERSWL